MAKKEEKREREGKEGREMRIKERGTMEGVQGKMGRKEKDKGMKMCKRYAIKSHGGHSTFFQVGVCGPDF